jgi:hypothetical protein
VLAYAFAWIPELLALARGVAFAAPGGGTLRCWWP